MNAPITCPECGAHHSVATQTCGCGHKFTETSPKAPEEPSGQPKEPPAEPPISIDLPFDIGKPLATSYAVSPACPKCGSSDYQAVKSKAMVAYASDRECRVCGTRYTPPTPFWARMVFGVIGLAAMGVGVCLLFRVLIGKGHALSVIADIAVIVVGFACLYKAATK